MEVNTTTSVPAPPPTPASTTKNHTYKQQHLHPQNHNQHQQDGNFTSKTILITISALTSVTVLFTIFVVVLMLRRLKSSTKNRACRDNNSRVALDDTGFGSNASTALSFNSSPDVKGGGCLHGGNQQKMKMKEVGAAGAGAGASNSKLIRGVQVFTYKEIEVATGGFSDANVMIGITSTTINGDFGNLVMYRGILSDGTLAAIKLMRTLSKQGERAFRMQVDLLSRLQCPYLVELLGYCADQHHRVLVFEYMPNATLHHHLHHSQQLPLDWWTRMRIALDCAKALEFLHEHAAVSPVIHRDFKCTNVLLDHNFRAKVSDFGLARTGSDKINGQISTRVLGTTGYVAPEYASTGKLTTKSDVYSYGVVLLELLTGRVPVDIKRPPGEHVLVSWALPRLTNREKVVEMVDPALRGQYSKKDLIQIAAIAAMCIQPEADYRPLMTDVVQSLIPLVRNPAGLFY